MLVLVARAGTAAQYQIQARIEPAKQQMQVHLRITGLSPQIRSLLLDRRLVVKPGQDYHKTVAGPLQLVVNKGELVLDYVVPLRFQADNILWLNTPWYPWRAGLEMTVDSSFSVPAGWRVLSQGQAQAQQIRGQRWIWHWRETQPQQAIYLLAGPFHEQLRQGPGYQMAVWLLQAEPDLAKTYLDAAEHYIALYSRLLGAYPYSKFVLVENSLPTGFGLPSFTLIGNRVLRLPFIVNSAFPHEILHNWFGNGVYVDPAGGNWSEGLTTYLADYAIAESAGKGRAYRRHQLQKYADFVARTDDTSLRDFRSRHNDTSAAIGYSKSMMVFHMLRKRLGGPRFIQALRNFYRQYRFREASFSDLRRSFEQASGLALEADFSQWLDTPGAPAIELVAGACKTDQGTVILEGMLVQHQPGRLFQLSVPIGVEFADGTVQRYSKPLQKTKQRFTLALPKAVRRFALDPDFDLFRRLDPSETPPSFGQFFGTATLQLVLPANAPIVEYQAWLGLARHWQQRYPGLKIVDDTIQSTTAEPTASESAAGKRMLLGRNNRLLLRSWRKEVQQRWQSLWQPGGGDCRAVTMTGQAWLDCRSPAAIAALSRKLPHYSRYSYLVLGANLQVQAKGQWPVAAKAMQHWCGQAPAVSRSWPISERTLLTQ